MGLRLPRPVRLALLAPYLAVFYPFLLARRAASARRTARGWRTWVGSHLLLGGFLLARDVLELRREGVRAVVNVSSELIDPVGLFRAAGIAYLRVPCWDFGVPTLEDADRGVRLIADHIARGERVYVHCASGVGRSVLLTLCYLATDGGLDVDEALATVCRLRPRVAMRPPQRAFVDRYVAHRRGAPA